MEKNKKIALGFLVAGTVMYFATKEEPKPTEGQILAGDTVSLRGIAKLLFIGGAVSLVYQTFIKK
jgi:hypothetical protein